MDAHIPSMPPPKALLPQNVVASLPSPLPQEALQATTTDTLTEIQQCGALKASLEQRNCIIPLKVVNEMLIMSERIKDAICTLALTHNLIDELNNDNSSTIYSLQNCNKIIEMTLKNAIYDFLYTQVYCTDYP